MATKLYAFDHSRTQRVVNAVRWVEGQRRSLAGTPASYAIVGVNGMVRMAEITSAGGLTGGFTGGTLNSGTAVFRKLRSDGSGFENSGNQFTVYPSSLMSAADTLPNGTQVVVLYDDGKWWVIGAECD